MSGSRDSGARSTGRLEGAALAACGVTLRALYGGTALLGALLTPPERMLLVAPAAGVGAFAVTAGLYWYLQQRWPSRQLPLSAAVVAAAAVPFCHAVDALGGVGAALVLAVMTLLTVSVSEWITTLPEPARSTAPARAAVRDRPPVEDPDALPDLLRVLPLQVLCQEWHAAAAPTPQERAGAPDPRAVHQRTLLLEELSRRDPVGARWLDHGAGVAPELCLCEDAEGGAEPSGGPDEASTARLPRHTRRTRAWRTRRKGGGNGRMP